MEEILEVKATITAIGRLSLDIRKGFSKTPYEIKEGVKPSVKERNFTIKGFLQYLLVIVISLQDSNFMI